MSNLEIIETFDNIIGIFKSLQVSISHYKSFIILIKPALIANFTFHNLTIKELETATNSNKYKNIGKIEYQTMCYELGIPASRNHV